MKKRKSAWYVYVIRTESDKLYTGITTDVARRFAEHGGKGRGAKFFRASKPAELLWQRRCKDRAAASRVEYRIKRLPRARKLDLVFSNVRIFDRKAGFLWSTSKTSPKPTPGKRSSRTPAS